MPATLSGTFVAMLRRTRTDASSRFVEVEELAALALFLCSDGGASVTGAALPVDGGWTAH